MVAFAKNDEAVGPYLPTYQVLLKAPKLSYKNTHVSRQQSYHAVNIVHTAVRPPQKQTKQHQQQPETHIKKTQKKHGKWQKQQRFFARPTSKPFHTHPRPQ